MSRKSVESRPVGVMPLRHSGFVEHLSSRSWGDSHTSHISRELVSYPVTPRIGHVAFWFYVGKSSSPVANTGRNTVYTYGLKFVSSEVARFLEADGLNIVRANDGGLPQDTTARNSVEGCDFRFQQRKLLDRTHKLQPTFGKQFFESGHTRYRPLWSTQDRVRHLQPAHRHVVANDHMPHTLELCPDNTFFHRRKKRTRSLRSILNIALFEYHAGAAEIQKKCWNIFQTCCSAYTVALRNNGNDEEQIQTEANFPQLNVTNTLHFVSKADTDKRTDVGIVGRGATLERKQTQLKQQQLMQNHLQERQNILRRQQMLRKREVMKQHKEILELMMHQRTQSYNTGTTTPADSPMSCHEQKCASDKGRDALVNSPWLADVQKQQERKEATSAPLEEALEAPMSVSTVKEEDATSQPAVQVQYFNLDDDFTDSGFSGKMKKREFTGDAVFTGEGEDLRTSPTYERRPTCEIFDLDEASAACVDTQRTSGTDSSSVMLGCSPTCRSEGGTPQSYTPARGTIDALGSESRRRSYEVALENAAGSNSKHKLRHKVADGRISDASNDTGSGVFGLFGNVASRYLDHLERDVWSAANQHSFLPSEYEGICSSRKADRPKIFNSDSSGTGFRGRSSGCYDSSHSTVQGNQTSRSDGPQ